MPRWLAWVIEGLRAWEQGRYFLGVGTLVLSNQGSEFIKEPRIPLTTLWIPPENPPMSCVRCLICGHLSGLRTIPVLCTSHALPNKAVLPRVPNRGQLGSFAEGSWAYAKSQPNSAGLGGGAQIWTLPGTTLGKTNEKLSALSLIKKKAHYPWIPSPWPKHICFAFFFVKKKFYFGEIWLM